MFYVHIFSDGIIDKDFVEEYHHSWRAAMERKCSLVCFRENSDEIVGLSLYFIEKKKDSLEQDTAKLVLHITKVH